MPINIPLVKLPWWPLGPPQGRGAYCHSQSSWALAMRESRHPPWKSHGETMANHGEPRHRAMAVLHLDMYLWLAANSSSRQLGSKIVSVASSWCIHTPLLCCWQGAASTEFYDDETRRFGSCTGFRTLDCLVTPRQLCALAVLNTSQ